MKDVSKVQCSVYCLGMAHICPDRGEQPYIASVQWDIAVPPFSEKTGI